MDFLPRTLKIQKISEQPPACAGIARSDPPAASNASQIVAGQISRVSLHYFAAPKVLMPVPEHPEGPQLNGFSLLSYIIPNTIQEKRVENGEFTQVKRKIRNCD